MGYHRAGFDVVGVDIEPQPHYPFQFQQADALKLLSELLSDDRPFAHAIHASPPCQGYTTMTQRRDRRSPGARRLIGEVRGLLEATGLPYVIENVAGALSEMQSPFQLTGSMFGLGVHRPRLFESNMLILVPGRGSRVPEAVGVYGKAPDGRRLNDRADGTIQRAAASLEQAQEAMGMDWADWHGTKEAIPPAYTEFIGRQLLEHLSVGNSTSELPDGS